MKEVWIKRSGWAAIFSLIAHIFLIVLLFQLLAIYADPLRKPVGYSFGFSYDFKFIFLFMVLIFIGFFFRKRLSLLWLKIFSFANVVVAVWVFWKCVQIAKDAGVI